MEMAGGSGSTEETTESGGWWGSWITSAKSKSAEVYSMVKKDLDEIGSAVRSEASHVYSTTSCAIGKTLKLDEPESTANVMKKSLSTFIDQVSTVLNPEPDDEDTEVIHSTGETTMFSTYRAELEALQRVDATYLVPADSPELEAWRGSEGGGDAARAACARRARSEPLLAAQYERLVPAAVSHDDFWERYLFRVALLQDRLAAAARRRASSDAPAAPAPTSSDPVLANLPLQSDAPITRSPEKTASPLPSPAEPAASDAGVVWDDEDFSSEVDLTEEQQILLLQEYEKEIALKKQNKNGSPKDVANNNAKMSPEKLKQSPADKIKKVQAVDKAKSIDKSKIADKAKSIDKSKGGDKAKSIDKSKGADKSKSIDKTRSKIVDQSKVQNKNNGNTKDTNKGNTTIDKVDGKSDICGNNLVEDYFDDKETRKVKDDASSNSDESWEKEFEIEEKSA